MQRALDLVFKTIGTLIGIVFILFGGLFLIIGMLIAFPVYFIRDGYEFGINLFNNLMYKPTGSSPWSKLPVNFTAPGTSTK